jgi:hypothetical protein
MSPFIRPLMNAFASLWRSFSARASLFCSEGWDLLLRRDRARTRMAELGVRQKELEITRDAIKIAKSIESIKSPELREKLKDAIFGRVLLPSDDVGRPSVSPDSSRQ